MARQAYAEAEVCPAIRAARRLVALTREKIAGFHYARHVARRTGRAHNDDPGPNLTGNAARRHVARRTVRAHNDSQAQPGTGGARGRPRHPPRRRPCPTKRWPPLAVLHREPCLARRPTRSLSLAAAKSKKPRRQNQQNPSKPLSNGCRARFCRFCRVCFHRKLRPLSEWHPKRANGWMLRSPPLDVAEIDETPSEKSDKTDKNPPGGRGTRFRRLCRRAFLESKTGVLRACRNSAC